MILVRSEFTGAQIQTVMPKYFFQVLSLRRDKFIADTKTPASEAGVFLKFYILHVNAKING
ncbi:hypothetical protein BCT49_23460 [Vibrio lentus]|uniref:Uncharacterized protein n=1 Tax=Vibrio lentus TaxID=136468 RepID=A0A2N7KGF7_9VIBR|nr:hypothetical protein BCT49_23460 [Vibrio lentus]